MLEADLHDLPLPALYHRGQALLRALEGLPSSDQTAPQLVEQGRALWRQAAAAADALALFSANEDLDDLATADIKYLLIPFYTAQVLGHSHPGAVPLDGRGCSRSQMAIRLLA
jgi:hypothetical protein